MENDHPSLVMRVTTTGWGRRQRGGAAMRSARARATAGCPGRATLTEREEQVALVGRIRIAENTATATASQDRGGERTAGIDPTMPLRGALDLADRDAKNAVEERELPIHIGVASGLERALLPLAYAAPGVFAVAGIEAIQHGHPLDH